MANGVRRHGGRVFDREPGWDVRNWVVEPSRAGKHGTPTKYDNWQDVAIHALDLRVKVLEAGVTPPTPTPTPSPTPTPPPPPPTAPLWDCIIHPRLDQGAEGECVGFGTANQIATQPGARARTDADAESDYELAQRLNGDTPDEQSGTTVLAGCKAAKQLGWITAYQWLTTVDDILVALKSVPVGIGSDWTDGMMKPDSHGVIHPDQGSVVGGHRYNLVGYTPDQAYLYLLNSWGSSWGTDGVVKVPVAEFRNLFANQGEAVVLTKV